MTEKNKYGLLLTLLLLFAVPAIAQNETPGSNRTALLDFVAGFETVALPFQLDPPVSNREAYPLVVDRNQRITFLRPHGLEHNTHVRAGQVIFEDSTFIALTVLVSLNEEHAWYVITFSQQGEAVDKNRIAGYSNNDLYRYEHWSEVTPSLQIEHTSVSRFYDQEGGEEACTRTRWVWQLLDDGTLDTSGEEISDDCAG